ncbi:translation initiation factor IF-2-like [Talpa occidentalis]|uniref:translation initiation factor IF-2-like n=1 Tax=Talpa occidentalis TaxID=50954 RepID=UPI00188F5799|nr:translation initiation factor IF-2-like [Talpa occidentalis]
MLLRAVSRASAPKDRASWLRPPRGVARRGSRARRLPRTGQPRRSAPAAAHCAGAPCKFAPGRTPRGAQVAARAPLLALPSAPRRPRRDHAGCGVPGDQGHLRGFVPLRHPAHPLRDPVVHLPGRGQRLHLRQFSGVHSGSRRQQPALSSVVSAATAQLQPVAVGDHGTKARKAPNLEEELRTPAKPPRRVGPAPSPRPRAERERSTPKRALWKRLHSAKFLPSPADVRSNIHILCLRVMRPVVCAGS